MECGSCKTPVTLLPVVERPARRRGYFSFWLSFWFVTLRRAALRCSKPFISLYLTVSAAASEGH